MADNSKYCFSFNEFFSCDDDFLETLNSFKSQVKDTVSKIETMELVEKLDTYYKLSLVGERLVTYAELNSDLDITNEKYLNYKDQAYNQREKLNVIKDNINHQILSIPDELDVYILDHEELKPFYMHLYEVMRLKKHSIYNNVVINENTLIYKVNSLYTTMLNVNISFKEIEIDDTLVKVDRNLFQKYIASKDRRLRQRVFSAYMDSLSSVNKSIGGLFDLRYKLCFDIATERQYSTILEQLIAEDDLNMKIIDYLIEGVHSNLSLLKRYLELKKKRLGYDEICYYDLNIASDYNPKYDFSSALEIVKNALSDMGDTYLEKIEKVVSGGMIDAFPQKNKFGGGYHYRNYTKPMILMNYKDNFKQIPTIAHEIGHAVNGLFIRENHSFQDFHFSLFLSEIASTVNEDRVRDYMYRHANEDEKIIHLEDILDKMISSIFLQTLFLEFEKNLCCHIEQGKSVQSEMINEEFLQLFKTYYQGMHIDEELKYLWQTRMHLFFGNYRYYNFQYATGKIASLVINKNINDGKLDEYLQFLTIGGSRPTLDALSVAGVDLTKKEIYQNAMNMLSQLLDEYEMLLK